MPDQPSPSSKPLSTRADAVAVLKRLRDAGHVAYLAGGCVRDELLGLDPKDHDVATDAPPDVVRKAFTNTQAVGAAFGVILVRHGKSVVEVATFRSEGAYEDGRRPSSVRFTTAEEDAKRRDFTINGLFLDPIENRVIDYVGGQADLKNKILRAIGNADERFDEDHLRLLRAVRFAARFDLTIDPATADAIRAHAEQLSRISPERIAEELRLMLTPVTRVSAWSMLEAFSLDDVIFRFLKLSWPAPALDVSANRRVVVFDRVAPIKSISFGLALAAVSVEYAARRMPALGDWLKLSDRLTVRQIVHAMRQALRISNEEADSLEGTLLGLDWLIRTKELPVAGLKRFLARPTASDSRTLLGALPKEFAHAPHQEQIEARLNELSKSNFAPPPLITGDDLTAAGLKPGPLFKRVLDEVYDAQLENRVNSKDEAMRIAIELAKPE